MMAGDDKADEAKGSPFSISKVQAIVGIVAAIVAAYGTYTTIVLGRISSSLSQTKEEREWAAKIFDKYSDLVTRERLDERQRISGLSGLLALTSLIGDEQPGVRDDLKKAIRDQSEFYANQLTAKSPGQTGVEQQETQALIKAAATISNRVTADLSTPAARPAAAAPTAASPWNGFKVDIFWCESSLGSVKTAQDIAALQASIPGANGRWRVRELSQAINARPGYGIQGFLIRYNPNDGSNESAVAQQLAVAINRSVLSGSGGGSVTAQRIAYPTPNYISAFVCP